MGGIIRLFTLPSQMKALERERQAFREEQELALQQAEDERQEAGFQADVIAIQAQKEAEAIADLTRAEVQADRFNARQLADQADAVTAAANIDEVRQRRESAGELSTQFAVIANTGFQTEDFADVIRTSAEEAEMDRLLIREQGILNNLDLQAQSNLKFAEAENAALAGATEIQSVLRTGKINERTALFTGKTRSRASEAAAIRAGANSQSARARKTSTIVDTFAQIADDGVKAYRIATGI